MLIAVALGIAATACQTFFGLLGGPRGPYFPHDVHAAESLDCTSCHAGAEEQEIAGFPATANGCMLCHQEIDAAKPPDRQVAAFLVEGKPRWLARPAAYGDEVRFDHGKHATAGVECATCHGTDPSTGEGLTVLGGKAQCLDCHARTERGNDCAVCHRVLRKDEPPPDHAVEWKRLHGVHARVLIPGTGETGCAQCHDEESCNRCHAVEPPRSHTSFWRQRGHGLTAAIDRTTCSTCHQPDYCTRCHQTVTPRSHRGSFGPPLNRHCATCHLPATGLSCGACHTTFPAHDPGPSLPPSPAHTGASNNATCLSCHVALSHPDPGGSCRTCHR